MALGVVDGVGDFEREGEAARLVVGAVEGGVTRLFSCLVTEGEAARLASVGVAEVALKWNSCGRPKDV